MPGALARLLLIPNQQQSQYVGVDRNFHDVESLPSRIAPPPPDRPGGGRRALPRLLVAIAPGEAPRHGPDRLLLDRHPADDRRAVGGQQRADLLRGDHRQGGAVGAGAGGGRCREVEGPSRGARPLPPDRDRGQGRGKKAQPGRRRERPARSGAGGRPAGGSPGAARSAPEAERRGIAVKKAATLALGILTSVGGFFDVGNLATSAQAGGVFRLQLLWPLLLGTLLVIFLVEMSGRFAAVTRQAMPDAIRTHLGFATWLVPFLVLSLVHFLVLGAEIGGICFALHLVSGLPVQAWALPVAVLVWLFLWRASFSAIENSTSLLGLLTLAFVVAAWQHRPPTGQLLAGMLPTLPHHDPARYWFIAVSLLGAVIAPYMFYFYSSGAVEDKWDDSYIGVNRGVSVIGMAFGSVISIGAVVVAAVVLAPRGIQVDDYHQAALMLTTAFPFWGFVLFAASMAIACLGAAA